MKINLPKEDEKIVRLRDIEAGEPFKIATFYYMKVDTMIGENASIPPNKQLYKANVVDLTTGNLFKIPESTIVVLVKASINIGE